MIFICNKCALLLLPCWYIKRDCWCISELWKSCVWLKMQNLMKALTIGWICYDIMITYRDWMGRNRNNWVCNEYWNDGVNPTVAILHTDRFSLINRDSSVHPHICTESLKLSSPSKHSKRGRHSSMHRWAEWILQLRRSLFYEPAPSHTLAHKNRTKLFRRWVPQGHVPPFSLTQIGNNVCYVECS